MIQISAAVFGLGLILFGLSQTLWLSLLLMLVVGFGMMQGMAASNTVIQTLVPEDRRGRVMSYYTMAFVGMAPFGSLMAGWLAHTVGAPHAVMITGAFCCLGAVWFTTQLKAIRTVMRPIYLQMGIIRSPLEPSLEDQAGKPG
jgi:MFS family permease